ncbi:MAG: hypothetical protein NXH73_12025 [Flavobacteriaceae bacterium]|nr:hypothetical protein [Flavobacteriaceae bacterium]
MKHFLKQVFYFGLIGIIPMVVILITYLVTDPFKVLYTYDSFYDNNSKSLVGLNKGYVSTETFLNNVNILNQEYDSFIFGNSRSIFYQTSEWKKHLPENSKPFHFDGSSEAIGTILKKIELIDKQGLEIKNALLVLDPATLIQVEPETGHLYITPPALVNNKNTVAFHWTFFKTYVNPKFLVAFIDYKFSGKVKPYMTKNKLINEKTFKYELLTNEIQSDVFDDLIAKKQYFTEERMAVFYEREPLERFHERAINTTQEDILKSIYSIFSKHKTDYKIIISPLYDQKKLNPDDLKFLEDVFGKKNVFDFSGINAFTENYRNYYENSHYRPEVATAILNQIYKED